MGSTPHLLTTSFSGDEQMNDDADAPVLGRPLAAGHGLVRRESLAQWYMSAAAENE